jgi:hypothetical protein
LDPSAVRAALAVAPPVPPLAIGRGVLVIVKPDTLTAPVKKPVVPETAPLNVPVLPVIAPLGFITALAAVCVYASAPDADGPENGSVVIEVSLAIAVITLVSLPAVVLKVMESPTTNRERKSVDVPVMSVSPKPIETVPTPTVPRVAVTLAPVLTAPVAVTVPVKVGLASGALRVSASNTALPATAFALPSMII